MNVQSSPFDNEYRLHRQNIEQKLSTSQSNTSRSDVLLLATAEVVSAYVSLNMVALDELPQLIETVQATLTGGAPKPRNHGQHPAVPIDQSVTDDIIYCLEDGRGMRSLARHLRKKYALTPNQYREKWNLPADYPMVAPSYSRKRSEIAKKSGLGKRARL